MNKIGLVISREYLSRVKKKSFIIMSILGPVLIAGIFLIPLMMAMYGGDSKTIVVKDESGLFSESFKDESKLEITFSTDPLETLKDKVKVEEVDAVLFIPNVEIDDPEGLQLYSKSNLGFEITSDLSRSIRDEIEQIKLKRSGISQEALDNLKVDLDLTTINLKQGGEEEESSTAGASVVGYISAFMIYMFIFIYGAQIMRGVIEEKTSRVVEVIISSVRPFEMMMGKVIGIAGVGLTQLVIWIVFSQLLISGITMAMGPDVLDPNLYNQEMGVEKSVEMQQTEADVMGEIMMSLDKIDIPMVVIAFLFFFVGGYLLYGALFAAVGSAVDSDADAQQFMLPVSIPLILSIIMLGPIIQDPNGSLAFWMSMIPFSSPVVMMMRVAFGVPVWELALSMLFLIGGFILTIWVAGRIYRVGILMHGTKVNYKVLAKWFMTKQ